MNAIVALLPVTAFAIAGAVRFAYHRGMAAGYIACRLDDIQAMAELDQEDETPATNGVRPLTPPTPRRRDPHI